MKHTAMNTYKLIKKLPSGSYHCKAIGLTWADALAQSSRTDYTPVLEPKKAAAK